MRVSRSFVLLSVLVVAAVPATAQEAPADLEAAFRGPAAESLAPALLREWVGDLPPSRRIEVAKALARLAPVDAAPILAESLRKPEQAEAAAMALRGLSPKAVAAALVPVLPDLPETSLPHALAVAGSAQVPPASLAPFLSGDPPVSDAALRALGLIPNSETATILTDRLHQSKSTPPPGALIDATLRVAGDDGLNPMIAQDLYRALESTDLPLHARRGVFLGRCENPATLADRIRAVLSDPNQDDLYGASIQQIRRLPEAQAWVAVASLAPALPPASAAAMLDAATSLPPDWIRPALHEALSTEDTKVQEAAIRALARAGSAESVPLLVAVATANAELRPEVERALIRVPDATSAILKVLPEYPALAATLGNALAGRGDPAALPTLLDWAAKDPTLGPVAWKGLGRLATPDDLDKLIDALPEEENALLVRPASLALVRTARRLEDPTDAGPRLARAMHDAKSPAQQRLLLDVLAALGGPAAVGALQETVQSGSADTRDHAVRALIECDDPATVPVLQMVHQNPPAPIHRALAARRLRQLAPQLPPDQAETILRGLD